MTSSSSTLDDPDPGRSDRTGCRELAWFKSVAVSRLRSRRRVARTGMPRPDAEAHTSGPCKLTAETTA
jgi:hypothetical protein